MSTPTRPTRKATATPMSAIAPELRPVTALRGVGEALAEKLQKLGIVTVQDLLFLLPLRYEDRTRITPIGSLQIADRAVVEGEVQLAEVAFRGRRRLSVYILRVHHHVLQILINNLIDYLIGIDKAIRRKVG